MKFIIKAYKDYHIIVLLFFMWAILYSFHHLVDDGLSVLSSYELQNRKMIVDLFLHLMTFINGILILKEKTIGLWMWIISAFIAYDAAFLLFEYKETISVEFLIKKALYLLIPACLLFLKQNGQSGWKVLFGKRQQGENDSLQAKH